jgi:signal transduction histidine kinase
MNICNNAFYAVGEKKKRASDLYEPRVLVATGPASGRVKITVRDNGIGIPQKFREKIFQPFFTTMPAGKGTGLGLSLSYDIIKAMGGEIKVDSKEGEWTEFSILLNGANT